MEVINRSGKQKQKYKSYSDISRNGDIRVLPVDFFLLLAKYLSGIDVIRLSCTCQYVYEAYSYEKVWKDLRKRDGLILDSQIMKVSMEYFRGDDGVANLRKMGLEKAFYICHKKVNINWKNGKYKYFLLKKAKMISRDNDHLVTLTDNRGYSEWIIGSIVSVKPNINYLINVYDLGSTDFGIPIHKDVLLSDHITVKQYMFDLYIEQIYKYRNHLAIVFGKENKVHKLVVLDINKNFREVWADDDDHYFSAAETEFKQRYPNKKINEIIHFHKDKYFRINLSFLLTELGNIGGHKSDEIDVKETKYTTEKEYKSRKNKKTNVVKNKQVWPMPENSEVDGLDICFDETYLVMTGRNTDDDFPLIFGWNIKTVQIKLYFQAEQECNIPHICKFFKVEVKDEKVYALLDQRTLLIWDADEMKLLKKVNLSDAFPGRRESNMNSFLKLSSHGYMEDVIFPPFLVTVSDLRQQAIRVLDREGNYLQDAEWRTGLLDGFPCHNSKQPFMDVMINNNFIVIQYVEDFMRFSEFIVLPLPLGK